MGQVRLLGGAVRDRNRRAPRQVAGGDDGPMEKSVSRRFPCPPPLAAGDPGDASAQPAPSGTAGLADGEGAGRYWALRYCAVLGGTGLVAVWGLKVGYCDVGENERNSMRSLTIVHHHFLLSCPSPSGRGAGGIFRPPPSPPAGDGLCGGRYLQLYLPPPSPPFPIRPPPAGGGLPAGR